MPSPIVIGIFEFTMMRTGPDVDSKKLAGLFHDYLQGGNGEFYRANAAQGEKVSVIRALPHEEAVKPEAYVEVLDYESAKAIVEDNDKYAIGLCSCRHEKHHTGEKECDIPLEKCSTLGGAADFLIRNNLAREVSKTEMLENIEHSKEHSLVLNADNVQKNVTFICHCCSCCCNALLGVSKFGYPGIVVTSNFIAEMDPRNCVGCAQCADACPVNAVTMVPVTDPKVKRKKEPQLDASLCLGCGVCALNCETGGMGLVARPQRVLHPETTFERIILQSLERGNLQNQLFDNPQSIGQKFMRGFVGGFLRLSPVKKALASDALRSRFLDAMKSGVERQGKGWILEM
jgi:ferredoxin